MTRVPDQGDSGTRRRSNRVPLSGAAGAPIGGRDPGRRRSEAAALSRVLKPSTVRCLGSVDAAPLASRVLRLSDRAWRRADRTKENRYPCFHHTRHVIFRFIEGARDPARFYSTPAWPVWRPWLLPIMRRVAASYGFVEPVFPKAMLARLESGQGIDLHLDGGGANPLVHKVHVPIQTDPAAVIFVKGARLHLASGYAWEINNLAEHGAFNAGARDRIHFIFEVFEGLGRQVHEETEGGLAG